MSTTFRDHPVFQQSLLPTGSKSPLLVPRPLTLIWRRTRKFLLLLMLLVSLSLLIRHALIFAGTSYVKHMKISIPHGPLDLPSSSLTEIKSFPRSSHPVDSFEYGVDKLRGKKVVIIGDSVSRYRYINLVYYIANRERLSMTSLGNSSEPGARNPNNEHTYSSWEEFFEDAGGFLNGRESCDCYRDDQASPIILENRHYVDEEFDVAFYL